MSKEKFMDKRMTGTFKIKLDRDDHSCGKYWEEDKARYVQRMDTIVSTYSQQGYKLTLRQLYYQLVAREWHPNDDKVYAKLSSVLDDCRYSGRVDWSAIEDRGRIPHTPYTEESVAGAIENALTYYNLDKREGQPIYAELWTEKDAISNILKDAVHKYTITVGINKGFASSTAIYNSYQRFIDYILEKKKVVVLYFGDHDPSGLDMVRDIRDRLEMMMSYGDNMDALIELVDDGSEEGYDDMYDLLEKHDLMEKYEEEFRNEKKGRWEEVKALAVVREYFEVRHIGLTKEQIAEFNLPPNPAKLTDPRAKKYVQIHGDISWEVDALQPADLKKIIEEAMDDILDRDVLAAVREREKSDKAILKNLVKNTANIGQFADPDEWGEWECPNCNHVQSDPENIKATCCGECDAEVVLSDVIDGKRKVKLMER